MKQIVFGTLSLMIATSASATSGTTSSVPDWVKRSTQNVAFNHLVKRMKNGPFYRVTEVQSSEVASDSGEEHALVVIRFDDSQGCKARQVAAECVPSGTAETLDCELSVTGCSSSEKLTTVESGVE